MKLEKIEDCLNYVQVNLNAPKNLQNSFGNYKYRNLEGIFKGLKQWLKETGCSVVVNDEVVMVGDRIYIKATATFQKGEQGISVCGWAREPESKKGMDLSQITGTASSYARKYAMNGLFAIDDSVTEPVYEIDAQDNTRDAYPIIINQPEYTQYYPSEELRGIFSGLIDHPCFKGKKKGIKDTWKNCTSDDESQNVLRKMQKTKYLFEKEKEAKKKEVA